MEAIKKRGFTLPLQTLRPLCIQLSVNGAGFRDCHCFRTSLAFLTARQPEGFTLPVGYPQHEHCPCGFLRLYRGLPQGDLPPLSTLLVYHIVNQKSSIFRKKLIGILYKDLLSKLCKPYNISNSPRPQMWSGRSKFFR